MGAAQQPSIEQLKDSLRAMWTAGDFGQLARHTESVAQEFVDRLPLRSGMEVLDVACGTGNLAIPAARKGATVTGVDIAPNLLEQARRRARAEGLQVTFDEGDAEQLPYPDAQFDLLMSMFGAMFAPRPELTARELVRVLRPGGTLAMANWTAGSFAGEAFKLSARYSPPPPGVPPPILWGDENIVRQRLSQGMASVQTTRRLAMMKFPFPPSECVAFFREHFGPTKTIFIRLDEAQQKAYAADFERLFTANNRSSDKNETAIENEYLEVIAKKA